MQGYEGVGDFALAGLRLKHLTPFGNVLQDGV